eukprot:CAMPEP_0184031842 /NCGR_PEP_ID=MMETSP0955-20130417/2558_1 /TAXON_ID=627963 /ORGANISM="Aplanochytrium sp, Strain PBS07" /LENGTH=456 /DNA_ID=CAMNT_0026317705 /DNA_START=349 /DNA_END=1719 /DNA_ORIENTATION=+
MLQIIIPTVLFVDYVKSSGFEMLSNYIETLGVSIHEAEVKRGRVESFDLQNSELLYRQSDTYEFTNEHWRNLTGEIFVLAEWKHLLETFRHYLHWGYNDSILTTALQYVAARLVSLGKINIVETYVYHKSIEDLIDILLTRNRAEAVIAKIKFEIKKLEKLQLVWSQSRTRRLLKCHIESPTNEAANPLALRIPNLSYSRGSSSVEIKNLEIPQGLMVAISGANGSGKSSFFNLIMSCDSNLRPIDLHESININASMTYPLIYLSSNTVVEITQSHYWPLHAVPYSWMISRYSESESVEYVHGKMSKISKLLQRLEFLGTGSKNVTNDYLNLDKEMRMEHRDWFGSLSGGQQAKVEMVRKVFQLESCPKLLLLDEAFAAIDPISKVKVFEMLKSFCCDKGSTVLVIYHADGKGYSQDETCAKFSNDFFDANILFDGQRVRNHPFCLHSNDLKNLRT